MHCLKNITGCVESENAPDGTPQACQQCLRLAASHCTDTKPASLVNYQAEGARIIALTSDGCKFFLLILKYSIAKLRLLFILDLSERFRNLFVAHSSFSALAVHMDMARENYIHQVASFAQDLKLAKASHSADSPFWRKSGLFEKDDDIPAFFDTVDALIAKLEAPGDKPLSDRLFEVHGTLLNKLAHFNGLPPYNFGPAPEPVTFETKHAPFVPIEVVDDASMADLSVGPPVTDLEPLVIIEEPVVPEASTSGVSAVVSAGFTGDTLPLIATFAAPRTPPPEASASDTEADAETVARDVTETAEASEDDEQDAPGDEDGEGSEGSGSEEEEE